VKISHLKIQLLTVGILSGVLAFFAGVQCVHADPTSDAPNAPMNTLANTSAVAPITVPAAQTPAQTPATTPALTPAMTFRPNWLGADSGVAANTSFLANTKVDQTNFQTQLFGGEKNVAGLQQRYDDRNRDYDMHAQYGFWDAYQQQNYMTSNTGMSGNNTYHDIFNAARTTQASAYAASFRQANQRGDVSQSVVTTGAVTGVVSGNPVNLNLSDDSKVSTRTDFVHGNGEVKLTTPAMNCAVSMDARSASDPGTAALNNTERYKVVFSRSLPLELSSNVVYGASTQTTRGEISRPIVDHVVAAFDSVHGSDASGIPSEQIVRLGYGINF
jgi:hypothetical protein